jgi:hypothetical protein
VPLTANNWAQRPRAVPTSKHSLYREPLRPRVGVTATRHGTATLVAGRYPSFLAPTAHAPDLNPLTASVSPLCPESLQIEPGSALREPPAPAFLVTTAYRIKTPPANPAASQRCGKITPTNFQRTETPQNLWLSHPVESLHQTLAWGAYQQIPPELHAPPHSVDQLPRIARCACEVPLEPQG